MKETDLKKLLELRKKLILKFSALRDYKNNKNAIMKEGDHAKVLHETIVEIDSLLKNYVTFD
mgnify:CR=1 FL=1